MLRSMSERQIVEEIANFLVDVIVSATPRAIATVMVIVSILLVFNRIASVLEKYVYEVAENKRDRKVLSLLLKTVTLLVALTLALFALGFDEVATVLGTFSGVIILASSYALRNAIGEIVAGMYLIHDVQFVEGNTISTNGVTGEIVEVGMRRTRIRTEDGNITVISNSKIEPKWTYHTQNEETYGL